VVIQYQYHHPRGSHPRVQKDYTASIETVVDVGVGPRTTCRCNGNREARLRETTMAYMEYGAAYGFRVIDLQCSSNGRAGSEGTSQVSF